MCMLLHQSDCRSTMYTKWNKRSDENACDKVKAMEMEGKKLCPDALQKLENGQWLRETKENLWAILTCIACPLQVRDSLGSDAQPYVPDPRSQRYISTVENRLVDTAQGTSNIKKLIKHVETKVWIAKSHQSKVCLRIVALNLIGEDNERT